jgi:hypothetical protein
MLTDISHSVHRFEPLNSGTFPPLRLLSLITTFLRIHYSLFPITALYMVTINDSFVFETLYCPNYYTYKYD